MQQIKILAIGEIMIELSKQNDETNFSQSFAGDTYNTLYYLAQSPFFQTSMMTVVGKDIFSQQLKQKLKNDQINLEFIFSHADKQLGLYLIENDSFGERNFIYYRQDSAAKTLINYLDDSIIHDIKQFDAIYLSGITLAIFGTQDRKTLINTLSNYKKSGGKIFFDNNYRAALWAESTQAQQSYEKLHSLSDILFLTFDDERTLYNDSTIEDTYLRYQDQKGMVVLKNSEQPISVKAEEQWLQYSTESVTNVIDTTGAGDAFNAGFLTGGLKNNDISTACQQGAKLAAKVIQHKGAILSTSIAKTLLS